MAPAIISMQRVHIPLYTRLLCPHNFTLCLYCLHSAPVNYCASFIPQNCDLMQQAVNELSCCVFFTEKLTFV